MKKYPEFVLKVNCAHTCSIEKAKRLILCQSVKSGYHWPIEYVIFFWPLYILYF